MSWFNSKGNDIHCSSRSLKDLIDKIEGRPDNDILYEDIAEYYIRLGNKYKELINNMLEEGYSEHKSDLSCDIPDYKSFLQIEQKMIDDQSHYQDASICVEGFISTGLWASKEWTRDSATVWIDPIPNYTEVEHRMIVDIYDEFKISRPILLASDEPIIPLDEGTHIRVHGTPYFYEAWDGGRPARAKILVKECEIVNNQ